MIKNIPKKLRNHNKNSNRVINLLILFLLGNRIFRNFILNLTPLTIIFFLMIKQSPFKLLLPFLYFVKLLKKGG